MSYKNLPYSSTLEPILTSKCNLNCSYCFEKNKCSNEIDIDKFIRFITEGYSTIPNFKFYLMGGEPTLALDKIKKLLSKVKSLDINDELKSKLVKSITNSLTTNGINLDKDIDYYKDNKFTFQISLDGPKEVNDRCRVNHEGKGEFDKIQCNMDLLKESNIPFTVHGAISKDNYKEMPKITEFYLKNKLLYNTIDELKGNKDRLFKLLHSNIFMFVIEDNISDSDIDILLDSFIDTVEMFINTDLLEGLTVDERKYIALGFLTYQGGICGAGRNIFTLDTNFKGYGCHRLAEISEYGMNVIWDESKGFTNLDTLNLYNHPLIRSSLTSIWFTEVDSKSAKLHPRLMWCVATNYKYTGEISLIPPRYATLMAELSEFMPKLISYYDLNALDRYL